VKYDIEERGDFLIVRVIGNMTERDKPGVLIDAINDYSADGQIKKFLFNIEKVEDIDDDGIDVFINCLSLQSCNIEDEDIAWAANLDESDLEKEIAKGIAKQAMRRACDEIEEDSDFSSFEDDIYSLADVYKEAPNAPKTDCFILVKDDDVYDKLHDSGVSGLMTIYRTREDFTRDQGVSLAN
jgi:hypothetical protein